MRDIIVDIQQRIKAGEFVNEAAVSHGIVLRILSALSWPAFDPGVVALEHPLFGRRVDIALCHPRKKPVAFIEVKQIGGSLEAERQLFEYAFHEGVPMAILTTGQEWHFYLPGERGAYGERRVYGLDLLERDATESVERFLRYLDYQAVCSGQAIERARQDYQSIAKDREIQRTLPEAWNRLVSERDELLIEILADKVESICGFKPEPETAARFLESAFRSGTVSEKIVQPRVPSAAPRIPTSSKPNTVREKGQVGFELDGQWYSARSGRAVVVGLLQQLQERDPSFLVRFEARPENRKSKRRLVARSREELFQGGSRTGDIRSSALEIGVGSGWWAMVHLGHGGLQRFVKLACGVSGLEYGVDVKAVLS